MKVLNLYAGIGGNRMLWDNCDVTAIEMDPNIAKIYQSLYPKDTVFVDNAHTYLEKNIAEINKTYDLVWASPPCQSHSRIRRMAAGNKYDAIYPDMALWQEIIFLKNFAQCNFLVENVQAYYVPLVPVDAVIDRHWLWSNFNIPFFQPKKREVNHKKITGSSTVYGINITHKKITKKKQILRSMVNPQIGLHVLNSIKDNHNHDYYQSQLKLEI